jgi:hypothetical protein
VELLAVDRDAAALHERQLAVDLLGRHGRWLGLPAVGRQLHAEGADNDAKAAVLVLGVSVNAPGASPQQGEQLLVRQNVLQPSGG